MEIRCQGCEHAVSYQGEAPRFCQNCGNPFGSTLQLDPLTSVNEDITIVPTANYAAPEPSASVGETIGPYQLVRWLGSGGMGNVWEAIETETGRRVALKRLAKSMVSDETYVKRFVREAQLAAQISHPKVTFIYGAGNDNGQPYIAMELMPGETLADQVQKEGPLQVTDGVDRSLDVVEGLIAAHRLGMIHRDVKPSNCFLDYDGSVKIGDFGLSKSLSSTEVNLTQTGTFMGTPSYAAPEQIRGSGLDGRTDVYAIGATLFFLLTGRTPFVGDAMSVTAQIISDRPPCSSGVNSSIPKDLSRVITKCLEKEPSKRFQDLEQLKQALTPFASQRESIADVGRRLAAYMIDQTLIQLTFMVGILGWTFASGIYMLVFDHLSAEETAEVIQQNAASQMLFWGTIVVWTTTLFYYSFFEGRFGRALGKRLMGLKVVNSEGRTAGFWRCFVRTCLIPGGLGIPFGFAIWKSLHGSIPVAVEDHMSQLVNSLAFTYIPTLILVSTMRASNRLLGIHGMLSGTRVIRVNTGKKTARVPVVQPRLDKIEPLRFGPYETTQLMGESQLGKIYIGHNEPLNRDVWVIVRDVETILSSERINLARVTRQRWLEGGFDEREKRWDAFEAIHGVPIQTFVCLDSKSDWSLFGQLMLDVVDELVQANQDGTLPESLSLPQIWLDEDGHAKLLDKQLVNVVKSNSTETLDLRLDGLTSNNKMSAIEKSVNLVQEMGDLFHRTKVLPPSVQDFLEELNQSPKTESTMKWAREQLVKSSNQIGSLSWDSRLGVLSATMGIEAVLYSLVAGVLFLTCFIVAPIENPYRFFAGLGLGIAIPALFGWWFEGGPVFQFMNIQVCNSRGRPANRMVVALRSAISWLPAIALVGIFILLILLSESRASELEPEIGSLVYDLNNRSGAMFGVQLTLLFATVSLGIGLLFAIISPQRGLVDFLLRTRLMPK